MRLRLGPSGLRPPGFATHAYELRLECGQLVSSFLMLSQARDLKLATIVFEVFKHERRQAGHISEEQSQTGPF